MNIDSEYFPTLSMNLAAGRNYAPEFGSDVTAAIILNESAVDALGWSVEEAVGKSLAMGDQQRTVVGVVEDFHFADMRHQIEPVILFYQETNTRVLSVRIDKNAPREAVDAITAAWREINPDYPFSYTFFTDEYNKLFSDDQEFSAMLNQFTFIAIIIACLGLYGLASFSVDQKTKEIGIRKVFGANTGSLLQVVLTEYVVLIVVANLLAWGVAWYVMQQWLAGFAYRIDIPLSGFLVATVGTTLLAFFTVGREIFKVVKSKPVDSLRYE
jgi:putative ABC transport system permease protein